MLKSCNEPTLIPGTPAYAKKICERMVRTPRFMEQVRLALEEATTTTWVTDEELMDELKLATLKEG